MTRRIPKSSRSTARAIARNTAKPPPATPGVTPPRGRTSAATGQAGATPKQAQPAPAAVKPVAPTARPPSRAPSGKSKALGGSKGPRPERPSLLNLAAKLLAEKGEPMKCKEIVERLLARKAWTTTGKTPAATLASAIIREMKRQGAASRFVKKGRGLVAANARTTLGPQRLSV